MLACMSLSRHDLSACFVPDSSGPSKRFLVKEPGLTMLYLTMESGQGMPLHNHPGCSVTIQGMVGEATVFLDGVPHPLKENELVSFSGELMVSPRNDSTAAAAVLITLAAVASPAA